MVVKRRDIIAAVGAGENTITVIVTVDGRTFTATQTLILLQQALQANDLVSSSPLVDTPVFQPLLQQVLQANDLISSSPLVGIPVFQSLSSVALSLLSFTNGSPIINNRPMLLLSITALSSSFFANGPPINQKPRLA